MNNNKSSKMRFNQMNFYLVMANIFSFFVDVYDIICDLLKSIREFLISIYLNNTIYKIQYIDNFNDDEYNITNVYNLLINPYELFRVIFFNNNNNNEISLNFDNILYKLEKIIYGNDGFLFIKYYENNHNKTIIINLNLFKDKKYIINNNQLLISNIILDFIKGNINTNKIVHVALDDKDITDVVEFFSNSLKDNNLTVFEFIKLLNVDYFIEFNKDSKFIITDIYLDEKEYKLLDYINL